MKKKKKSIKPKTKKSTSKKVDYHPEGPFHVWFRPNRRDYILKVNPPKGCVFCEAEKVGVEIDSLCLYKSRHSMVILNKFPYNSGHLLVLPRRHCGDILDLSQEEFADWNEALRLVIQAVKTCYQPGGFNVGLNHGAIAGAGIPDHLHYHVVPRWSGDMNFFPLIAHVKNVIETPEQAYERYSEFFRQYQEGV